MKKIRADHLLVQQGLAPTRTKAQSLIMSGVVYCGTERIDKASQLFSSDTLLALKGMDHPYVSRGGLKLKAALDHFHIGVKDKIGLDVGASTGGFTDCLLKEGAKKVYAVDVGYGQLDWALRNDSRVVVIERTNFRNFDLSQLSNPIDLITVDVSFISLMKIIPKAVEIFTRRGAINCAPTLIALIKPQFEVGKKDVGKGGIVKDKDKQLQCVKKISDFCLEKGLQILGTLPSPILGQNGNQEYLLLASLPSIQS